MGLREERRVGRGTWPEEDGRTQVRVIWLRDSRWRR